MTDLSQHDLDADQTIWAPEVDLRTTVGRLRNRIALLEDVVDDLGRTLDRVERDHKNELAELKAEIVAIQGYRAEQIAHAIAKHETEVLTERLNAAQRRRYSGVCVPGSPR